VLTVGNPSALDYEKNTEFTLKIRVNDNFPGDPRISEAIIRIYLNDLNEYAPVLEDHLFQMEEFPKQDSLIGKIIATDDDIKQKLTYTIESGNDDQAIYIDSLSGEIYVADSSLFDLNVNQKINCMIMVSDDHSTDPRKDFAMLTIEIKEGRISLVTINGAVQKGPFIQGSLISIAELNESLEPTGRNFSTNILDNSGSFIIENVGLKSNYVQLVATGFYFNERTGRISESQLTLYCIADISNLEYTNINILSHIEYERLKYLISNGASFEEAKAQAQQDVLAIFNYSKDGISQSENMDIAQAGDDNAMLLAASVILQGLKSTGDFAELVNRISSDIKEDGLLDNPDLGSELINSVKHSNMETVRNNLASRYDELAMEYTIPDFEKYITYFIENTAFETTNEFVFPSLGEVVNCLHPDTMVVYDNNIIGAPEYKIAVDVPEYRNFSVSITGYGLGVLFNGGNNMEYERSDGEPDIFTFYTTATGRCEHIVRFNYMGHYPAVENKIIHFDYYADDNEEPFYSKDVNLITDWSFPDSTITK
jgi:hypothetical protein